MDRPLDPRAGRAPGPLTSRRSTPAPRRWPLLLYAGVCLAAMTWPGYAVLGNRIEPFVLGVPFSLAWIVGWVVLTFVVLVLFHATAGRDRRRGGT